MENRRKSAANDDFLRMRPGSKTAVPMKSGARLLKRTYKRGPGVFDEYAERANRKVTFQPEARDGLFRKGPHRRAAIFCALLMRRVDFCRSGIV